MMSAFMKENKQRKKGMAMLRRLTENIQRGLSLSPQTQHSSRSHLDSRPYLQAAEKAANAVKAGHFPVVAVGGGEPTRFSVELEQMHNPAFLRLLHQATEEYGFTQKGPLAVPCGPEELRMILDSRGWKVDR